MTLRSLAAAATILATCALTAPALAQQAFPASLAGHIVLPAATFIASPADAPADLKVSGKFTTGARVEAIGTVEGKSAERPTGISVPFQGQPIQGHSGIKRMADGTYWVLTDNGFGSKVSSPDSMLYLNHYRFDFARGTLERIGTVFLHDPDKKVPFRIVQEGTPQRYLTGGDFDTEGFQIVSNSFWIGDEFGPYLIKADMTGKVQAVHGTLADGKPVIGPDHPSVVTPAAPNAAVTFNARRSKGFEGLASSKDGRFLYAMLEGPIWDDAKKDFEKTADGKEYLRVLEFDIGTEKWTGRSWQYVLEANGYAIGDFNMIDATTALVIERDNGEGTQDKGCPANQRATTCFHDVARFKRVYKIEMGDALVGKPVRKVGYIDLMKIVDPNRLAKKPLTDGVLTFPFFTIENVEMVHERHIVVGNDNNLPFSTSRDPNKQDDNEFVLLEVEALLKAR